VDEIMKEYQAKAEDIYPLLEGQLVENDDLDHIDAL
jgi:hypothetical protein